MRIKIWTLGNISVKLVARAVEAAWPTARTTITTPTPPLPAKAEAAAGGTSRLARPDHYPLGTDRAADPIRVLHDAPPRAEGGNSTAPQS
ncbi:hypothetical protein [Actinomadura alba]